MISYASNTQGKRNLKALLDANWRILLTPGKHGNPPKGFRFAIDNGAWGAFKNNLPFNWEGFADLVDRHGGAADFIIVPDVVANAKASLELSRAWFDRLNHYVRPLLAVQDGMEPQEIGVILERYPRMGLFLGGSTEWKLKTMYSWGMVAHAFRRYYHVGRVNTVRRIRLCQEAGADSFDGTSATMYSCTIPKLENARRQLHLLTPEATSGH
jgi:hypothetical protein